MSRCRKILIATACVAVTLAGMGCEGPAGPAGSEGPQGEAGAGIEWKGVLDQAPENPQLNWAYYNTSDTVAYIYDGTAWDTMYVGLPGPAGADGVDMNSCAACHDSTTDMYAKQVQYMASTHHNGGNFERNGTSCAACHTHEGFIDALAEGTVGQSVASASTHPSPINCRTCHMIHTNYDTTDWKLRVTGSTTINLTGDELDLGKGTMCASCHQPRDSYTIPSPTGTDSVTISSPYWGPHHGPQSTILAGLGAAEFSGSVSYPSLAPHTTTDDGCVTCHMAEPYGAQAGGHTMGTSYQYHGHSALNTAGCVECHEDTDTLEAKVESLHSEIETLVDSLAVLLQDVGLAKIDSASGDVSFVGGVKVTSAEAAALWNFKTIEEDRSHGVHNPSYTRALLKNTIEALSK